MAGTGCRCSPAAGRSRHGPELQVRLGQPPAALRPPAREHRQTSPGCRGRWPRWGPARRSLPWPLASLVTLASTTWGTSPFRCVRWPGRGSATRPILLGRDPVGHVSLNNPRDVARLLSGLAGVGPTMRSPPCWAATPVVTLASTTRGRCLAAAGAGRGGADDAVAALAARAAGHVSLDNPSAVADLLEALSALGADDTVAALVGRTTDAAMFDVFLRFCPDEALSCQAGREPDRTPSQPCKWEEPTSRSRSPE